jgi:tetratricopeptide (TPR) repeat protein
MDFFQVERTFAELKAQYEAGDLSEEEFKAQLQELMVQDEQDRWWIIGYQSGLWYYHDGQQWVQDDPPPVAQRREQVGALCTEGATALDAGDWRTAVERYEAALALEPDHTEAAAGLEKASAGLAAARARAEAQVQVQTLTAEGTAALSAGDWGTAVERYEAALALEPDHTEAAAGLEKASAGLAAARARAEAQAEAAAQPEPEAPAEPEPEAIVEAAPPPVRPAEPEAAPVVDKKPWRRLGWIVAAVILTIIVAIVVIDLLSGGTAEPPRIEMWTEREVIGPGECTIIFWRVLDFNEVHLVGPGIDDTILMAPADELEVCPEVTSRYELKGPDWQNLSAIEIHVRE